MAQSTERERRGDWKNTMIHRSESLKKLKPSSTPMVIENDFHDPSGAVYDMYRTAPVSKSTAQWQSPVSSKAVIIRKPGHVTIAGESRTANLGDIFILPSTPPRPEPAQIDGWAVFAVLLVVAFACGLFLPLG